MTYLIDSDRVVEYLKGRPSAVELLAELQVDSLAISIITYGEVYEGIYRGVDPRRAEQAFGDFLSPVRILGISRATARTFALVSGELRRRGLTTPAADLLIAATALQHDLTLVTGNLRHFERVPGLRLYGR